MAFMQRQAFSDGGENFNSALFMTYVGHDLLVENSSERSVNA
jgi:hypothetical protein